MDIAVRDLKKTFGASPALHGVDLEIRSGELIGLLGPSGSGKTTLLRAIAGLETPTSGQILFAGQDALRTSVQERRVGFVFQNYALFRHMSVAENIAYGLHVRPRATRPSSDQIARRVTELLELVQLTGLDARFPGQLSGGQRQRVPLARSTHGYARICGCGCATSTSAPATPPFSSPMTRTRRWKCRIG